MKEHQGSGPLDMVTLTFSRIMMWAPFFIVLIILYEVVMRYFFAAATLWVNEMSLWIAGGIYLSAGLYAMLQRSHIRIFIIYDMAPLWLRRVFDLLSTLCVGIFALPHSVEQQSCNDLACERSIHLDHHLIEVQ